MERVEIERVVDDLFERSDKEVFRIFHLIADLALKDTVEQ